MGKKLRVPLQTKLFVLFFLVIIIPLSLCMLLLFRQSSKIIEDSIGSSYVARLNFFSNKMKLTVDNFYQDLLTMAVDREIRDMLQVPIQEGDVAYLELYNYLAQTTFNLFVKDNMIHSIGIYSQRGDWLFMNTRHSSRIFLDDLEELEWVEMARTADDLNRPLLVDSVPTNGGRVERVLAQYLPLWDDRAGFYYAYLSVNLDTEAVHNLLLQDFHKESPRNILIVDEEGELVCHSGPELDATELERLVELGEGSGFVVDALGGERMLITHSAFAEYGWQVFIVTPYHRVLEQVSVVTNFALTVFVLVLLFTVVMAYLLSKNLLSPLKVLFQVMRQVQGGELGATIPNRREDEIGLLYEGFNEMSLSLENLMQDLYQEELAKRDIQLKMMSYQINAHFLYNTLDAIHWIARINKVPKISSLVAALANYFRITLSEGKDMIPLSQVVELARNYMNIYAIKSDFVVELLVDIPEELWSYRTLKYIFQPLLENALNHGIEEKGADGAVYLGCQREGEDLVFTVRDTGAGIAPSRLAELKALLENDNLYGDGSFALRNINMQIKLSFGARYGMEIDSVLGEFTQVRVRVPAREE